MKKKDNFQLLAKIDIRYTGSNWLMPQSITILHDGKTFELKNLIDMGHDVSCGTYTCSYTEDKGYMFNELDIPILETIAQSKSVSMRIYGEHAHKDLIIDDFNKENILQIIELYNYFKNYKENPHF